MALRKKEILEKTPAIIEEESLEAVVEGSEEVVETPQVIGANEESIIKAVNEGKEAYLVEVKKQKRINLIVTITLIVVLIGAFGLLIGLSKTYEWITYVSLLIMIIATGGSFLFSRSSRKLLTKKAMAFMKLYFTQINKYIYNDANFKDVVTMPNEELKKDVFVNARFYKGIQATKSRNFVSSIYNNKKMVSCDIAGSILVKNKTSPMFLGKFIDIDNDYDKNFVILFQLKGKELSRPIDDTEGLKLVEGNNKYVIYTNDEQYKKILTKEVINALTSFKINNRVIDVILSIRKGTTAIGIDYSDEFINIPIDGNFDIHNTFKAKEDLNKVLKIINAIKFK